MRPVRILALALLCVVAALGQTNKGGISGTVSDSAGAVVPAATVTITNLGTNQKLTLKTSEAGVYAASSLDPVTYSVSVEVAGFKKAFVDRVKVDTATTATVNVTLEAGAVENTVNVTAEAPVLNTQNATTSQTVTERQIHDVRLLNRCLLDLDVSVAQV